MIRPSQQAVNARAPGRAYERLRRRERLCDLAWASLFLIAVAAALLA